MKTKPINLFCIALTVLLGGWSNNTTAQSSKPYNSYENIEFKMARIQEPKIPNNAVNIKDFGAINGGYVLNTKAFADAIDAVSKKGGGKVIIPPGIWLTGPIILKSNIELHAETGALIKFSTDKSLYPIIQTSFEGLNTWRCISPIYGKNIENIAFTGNGVWDGSGEVWRQVKKSKLTESQWKKFVASGGVLNDKKESWYPSETFMKASVGADQNVRLDLKTKDILKDALRAFEGTIILISHDRDFLEGLATKVFEFGNKRVKEHFEDITGFLRNKKMENLREIERKGK